MAQSWSGPLSVVPGDPVVVEQMATNLSLTAESIGSAAASLRSIDDSSGESEAVTAFLRKAADLESRLSVARDRYAETGAALTSYSRSLAAAVEDSRPAVRDHERARDDFDAADRLVAKYEGLAMLEPPGPGEQEYRDMAAAQVVKREEARDRITTSARRVAAAHATAGAAAVVAIALIDDATDDGLRDSIWDDLGGVAYAVGTALDDVGDAISAAWEESELRDALAPGFESFQEWMRENDEWIGQVMDVVDSVSFVVGMLALSFPVLGAVALALTLLSVGVTLARAAAGTATLIEVGFAALSLLTLGTGKVLTDGALASVNGLRAAQAEAHVATGMSPALAEAVVAKEFFRSRPKAFSVDLFRSAGDSTTAHLVRFVSRERPGASAAEIEYAADILRSLRYQQVLNWAGQVQSMGQEVLRDVGHLRAQSTAEQPQLVQGSAW